MAAADGRLEIALQGASFVQTRIYQTKLRHERKIRRLFAEKQGKAPALGKPLQGPGDSKAFPRARRP